MFASPTKELLHYPSAGELPQSRSKDTEHGRDGGTWLITDTLRCPFKKGNTPHQQLVPAVTVRCSPSTGELYIYVKVLQVFLRGHTQDIPGCLWGWLLGVGAWRGWEELSWSAGEWAEFLGYRAESGVVLNPWTHMCSLVDRLLILRLSQPEEKG